MRANPAEHERRVGICALNGGEDITVNNGGNEMSARTFTGNVFRYRPISAGYNRSPLNQIIGLTEPLQPFTDRSVSWTLVRNVGCIIQIQHHWPS